MKKISIWMTVALAAMVAYPAPMVGQIASDLERASLVLTLYGDAFAHKAHAAKEWDWTNNANATDLCKYGHRIESVGGGAFLLKAGKVSANIYSGTITVADCDDLPLPVVFLVNAAHAEAWGKPQILPAEIDPHIHFDTGYIRLGASVDASTYVDGLSFGTWLVVPGTHSKFTLRAFGLTINSVREYNDFNLILGAVQRLGEGDWLRLGAYGNLVENHLVINGIDPLSGAPYHSHRKNGNQVGRLGFSANPFVPLGVKATDGSWSELASSLTISADSELLVINAGDGVVKEPTGLFGFDLRLPDAWNLLRDVFDVRLVTGTTTRGGNGIGIGLDGKGKLKWLTCDPSRSADPIAKSLGPTVVTWAFTCTAAF